MKLIILLNNIFRRHVHRRKMPFTTRHTRQDLEVEQRAAGRVREVDLSGFAQSRDQLRPDQHHRRQGGLGSGHQKSIVIFVQVPQLNAFQKIQTRLVRGFEKKFSGKHVEDPAQADQKGQQVEAEETYLRRSRTLVASMTSFTLSRSLEREPGSGLTGPGYSRSTSTRTSRLTSIEQKVDTFSAVYKKLTGMEVTFECPEAYL